MTAPVLVRLTALAITSATLIAGGCGTSSGTSTNGGQAGDVPTVVVTTNIWADVVANVACDGLARIETIIPSGADPHGFEPSLADRAQMEDAAIVIANGLSLEEGLTDTLDAVESGGTPVFRFADHLDIIGADGDGHDGGDPHVWFDPRRVATALPSLGETLVRDVGLDGAAIEGCLSAYLDQLDALDSEIVEMVSTLPESRRRLVTSHDSLGYFADRYGFEVIGTVIPARSTLAATNPAQLHQLADLVEAAGVPAIFAETQHSSDEAKALAAHLGDVDVVTLFSGTLGDAASGVHSYTELLRTDARLITQALR